MYEISYKPAVFGGTSAAFVRNFIQTGSIRRHISGFCTKFHTNRQYSAAHQRLLYEISYKPAVFGGTS
ncbi:hypothetical protein, partial [Paenibacillus sp. J5C2022]|uniref:hypothetical protein n=1 Tax=Paenibacillus sp. J5C2022 TaxID=2977129 RepID=UPI0021CEC9E3